MKKILTLFLLTFLLNGCTIYSEKQSEALSQSVYATKDSIDNARIDLAQQYINQATCIVVPPKKRIPINAIYSEDQDTTEVKIHSGKAHGTSRLSSVTPQNAKKEKKVVTLPEEYQNDKIVFVNSDEYKKLLEDKKVANQLKWDYYNLDQEKKNTELQVIKDKEINNKMVNDLNSLQKKVLSLELSGLWKDIIIIALLSVLGLILYIRITKPFAAALL